MQTTKRLLSTVLCLSLSYIQAASSSTTWPDETAFATIHQNQNKAALSVKMIPVERMESMFPNHKFSKRHNGNVPLVLAKVGGTDMICPPEVQNLAYHLLTTNSYMEDTSVQRAIEHMKQSIKTWQCNDTNAIDVLTNHNCKMCYHLRISLQSALDLHKGDFSQWDFSLNEGSDPIQLNDKGIPGAVWSALGPKKGAVANDTNGNIIYTPKKTGWDLVSWFEARDKGKLELVTCAIYINPKV